MATTVILLLLLTAASLIISRAVPTSSATRRCEDCGSTPVPYPLSTAPNCGDQSYKIRCDAGKLYFNTSNNTYPIISISPETQRLVIRPASFTNNNRTCVTTDFPTNGVQLDPALPFTITSSNTIMLLNCSDTVLRSPPPMNCTPTSLCHSYAKGSAEACLAAPICCTFRAGGSYYSISVSEGGCQAYRSFVNLDHSSPMSRRPDMGVEIQWVPPPEPACSMQADCDSRSTCGAGSGGVNRCLCDSRFNWDPTTGSCAPVYVIGPGESRLVQHPRRLLPKLWFKPKSLKIGETQEGSSSTAVTEANAPPKKIFTDNNNGHCYYNEVTASYFCDLD